MRINNNIMAMNTFRQYSVNSSNSANTTEKLSSGFRINRAGDDAAGLAISEKMRAQIRGLNMASKNSQDAISLVQTAEGALTETHSILQRMRELAVQSSSDTNDSSVVDRTALDNEFQALKSEIDDIASKTAFNGKSLLDGSLGATVAIDAAQDVKPGNLGVTDVKVEGFAAGAFSIAFSNGGTPGAAYTATLGGGGPVVSFSQPSGAGTVSLDFGNGRKVSIEMASHAADAFNAENLAFTVLGGNAVIQTGANQNDTMSIGIGKMDAATLGLTGAVNLNSQATASTAITTVNDAINSVSGQRSKLGAYQNRLQHKINNLDTTSENLSAAESRIRDLDMAKEMTTHTKNNILVQAATAMLAQANSAPQGVLQLLQ